MIASLQDIMTTRVVTISIDDRLHVAKEIFDHVGFHHLPVTDGEQLVGILTKKDMEREISPYIGLLAELPRDLLTLDRRVHQVMTRDPVHISWQLDVKEAAQIMLEKSVSCLPVVDSDKRVVGIVTWRDLLKECVRVI